MSTEKKRDAAVSIGSTAGSATSTLYTYAMAENTVILIEATVIGKSATDCYGVKKSAVAKNVAGVCSLIGSVQSIISPITDLALSTASVTIDVNSGNVRVRATGALGSNLDWQAYVIMTIA